MNTTTSALLTGAIVSAGRWSQDKSLNSRIIISVFVLALALTLMGQANAKLANQFGALVLISAVFGYGPSILNKLGYATAIKKAV